MFMISIAFQVVYLVFNFCYYNILGENAVCFFRQTYSLWLFTRIILIQSKVTFMFLIFSWDDIEEYFSRHEHCL